MKLFGNFLFWFIVFLVSSNLIYGSIVYAASAHLRTFSTIISPLPKLFSQAFEPGKASADFWQPDLSLGVSIQKTLELTSVAALSYDLTTDRLLYSKEINRRLPIASLTKIMTAIIALENLNIDEVVTVTKSASEIGEGTMGLSNGEKLTIEELLYGLLLQSGNDAGETLAQTSKFGREGYLHLMNKKAEDLGLSDTRFTNPTGLQGDGEQYGTAKELLILTRYALQNEKFAQIVATYQYDIATDSSRKAFVLFNETNLLTTYPGVKGVKTGYTDEAGMCLVTYLDHSGHRIISVLLNSQNRRAEMAELLDYSLKEQGIRPPRR